MNARPPITLWLLNRAATWPHEPMVRALSERYDVRIGRRVLAVASLGPATVPVNGFTDSPPGALMHEGTDDEYFVPIPLKCVGDPRSRFWQDCASAAGTRHLAELAAGMSSRFPARGLSATYDPAMAEQVIGKHFGRVRMNLSSGNATVGYYEMLQRSTAGTAAPNILVGYSQGGCVARYLAFLDEYVSARPCIAGVITVQSPNRGSPVASATKKSEVGRALAAVVLSLIRWLPEGFRGSNLWPVLRGAPIVDAVNGLLDALLHSWPAGHPHAAVWLTARKWLSGLEGIPDLAFYDLDPARLAEPGSVLHSIASYPLTATRHGAVVGADGSLCDFARALLRGAPWIVRAAARLRAGAIARWLGEAENIWRGDVMAGILPVEVTQPPSPLNGLDRDLPVQSHDFVIPAASQMLLPVTPAHVGNLVNPMVNHLTGATGADMAAVVELLRRL